VTAKAEHVGVFHRFELMRHWHEAERLPFMQLHDTSHSTSMKKASLSSPLLRFQRMD
jgi:hypothetical protein